MTTGFGRHPSRFLRGLLAIAAVLGTASPSHAIQLGVSKDILRGKARSSFITERAPALAPMGFVVFCMKNPGECAVRGQANAVVDLTPTLSAQLSEVNTRVNHSIVPVNDVGKGLAADRWTLSPAAGDCEDFALTKRAELVQRGFPASALRMAVARTRQGEGHAVLVVRTVSGDLVLDNRFDTIKNWSQTDLRWVSMQSGEDPSAWNRV